MYVTHHTNVSDRRSRDELWELYQVGHRHLSEKSVTREMLFRSEFDAVLTDPTNRLWVVRDETRPVSMSLIATDIAATRYLNRSFFERRYPERMAAGLVHYVMWVVAHPDYWGSRAIFELARGGLAIEQMEGALLVFDLPDITQPNDVGSGAELLFRLAQMVGPVDLELLGGDRYYALDFSPVDASVDPTELTAEEQEHART